MRIDRPLRGRHPVAAAKTDPLMHHHDSELERLLGRQLPPQDEGSIPDLNDMPASIIAEARALIARAGKLQAFALLWYYARADNFSHICNFIDDVVKGGESAAQWQRGQMAIAPDLSLRMALTYERERLLAPIGGYHGLHLRPHPQGRLNGAPLRFIGEWTYRTKDYRQGACHIRGPTPIVDADADVVVRRWLAGRIHRCLAPGHPPGLAGLHARIGAADVPGLGAWSHDARIAVAALRREAQQSDSLPDGPPGFRGPHAWYRDDGGLDLS